MVVMKKLYLELRTIYLLSQVEEYAEKKGYSIRIYGKTWSTGEHFIVLKKDDKKITLVDVGLFPYHRGWKVVYKN